MNNAKWIVAVSLVLVGLIFLLLRLNTPRVTNVQSGATLVFYCAAGIQAPVEAVRASYEQKYGVQVQVQYGGSGQLLSNLQVTKLGDLYLSADQTFIDIAREKGLIDEVFPVAFLTPVLLVSKGNPKGIQSLDDLRREDVRVSFANTEAASIGRTAKELIEKAGKWDSLKDSITVYKPTVNEVANDVKIGSVDVGIVWDAVANQYPELEAVHIPELDQGVQQIVLAVLKSAKQPTQALHFARYLTARDQGLLEFDLLGYKPVQGDVWVNVPEISFFSGGVNRLAIQDTLKAFEEREGVTINSVYNGCGILVAQMKAGQRPDAYFACDVSFVDEVQDLFHQPLNVSKTPMVMVVPKGNPQNIKTLEDLTKDNIRLGTTNPQQSALGALTVRLLEKRGTYQATKKNIVSQTPTADLLVNQIRTGSLDVVIVYDANTPYIREEFDIVYIDDSAAMAIQPYAISQQTDHFYLMDRLLQVILATESKEKFTSTGFEWLADK